MPSAPEPAPLGGLDEAWDCHLHVFGDPARYPLVPRPRYTPGMASPQDALRHAGRVGARRLVLVQAGPYGTDNRCLLDALAALGPAHRGVVALTPDELDDRRLADLHAAGVRGVRLNPRGNGPAADVTSALPATAARLRGSGWHIEVNAPFAAVDGLSRRTSDLDVPLVFDHLAGLALGAEGFIQRLAAAVALLRDLPLWVKLSGVTRAEPAPGLRARAHEAVGLFCEAAPDRLVWGSDWPHTPIADGGTGFHDLDGVAEAREMLGLVGSAACGIFVSNPTRLYD